MAKNLLRFVFLASFSLAVFLVGCGTSSHNNPLNTINTGQSAPAPSTRTIFVVVLENKNYADVVGSPAMPYFNGLFAQGALLTNYYADVHPSIGNYLMLETGNIETTNDAFSGAITDDNYIRELNGANKSWKVYADSIPSVGYLGGDVYPYLQRHNVATFFSDVQQSSALAGNIVPLSQLSSDLGSGNLPNVAFIIPNAYDDGHDCLPNTTCTVQQELTQADSFLKSVVPGILGSSAFQSSGWLAITFDESGDDATNGGGHVATLMIGSQVKAGYQSSATYQHQNLLRTICDSAGVPAPGVAKAASSISDAFK